MRLLITVLVLCTCQAKDPEERKAMSVLYENSDNKGATASLNMVGIVEFSQAGPQAKLMVNINLFSNSEFKAGQHGFHIHQMGNVYGGCTQTLGHFNPLDLAHGGPDSSIRHKGDFGNIEIVNNAFSGEIADQEASLYGQYTIIGRGVVLHEGTDDLGLGGDLGSTKTGNAGSRLACGVIGINSTGYDNASSSVISSFGLILTMTLLRFLLQ